MPFLPLVRPGNGDRGSRTARRQTRPARSGSRAASAVPQARARAVSPLAGALVVLPRTAFRTVVKEIRAGSRPAPAAAAAMTARMAW